TIANAVRLLKLPPEVQQGVTDGQLTAGHARAILQLDTPAAQVHLFRRIVRNGLSVRQAEQAASRGTRVGGGGGARRHGGLRPTEEELSRALGTKVRIRKSGKRGAIVIEFYSDEELDRLARSGFTALWLIGVWERSGASREIKRRMGNAEADLEPVPEIEGTIVVANELATTDGLRITSYSAPTRILDAPADEW
ncbi:MAG: hypothetical protein AAB368_10395, partial [bacterium]